VWSYTRSHGRTNFFVRPCTHTCIARGRVATSPQRVSRRVAWRPPSRTDDQISRSDVDHPFASSTLFQARVRLLRTPPRRACIVGARTLHPSHAARTEASQRLVCRRCHPRKTAGPAAGDPLKGGIIKSDNDASRARGLPPGTTCLPRSASDPTYDTSLEKSTGCQQNTRCTGISRPPRTGDTGEDWRTGMAPKVLAETAAAPMRKSPRVRRMLE
jgi:hypothetical protein